MSLLSLWAAASVAAFAPTGPWNVEAQEDLCLLSRQYGQGKDSFAVGFQPIFTQPQMELIVLSSARVAEPEIGSATVTREPDGKVFKGAYFTVGIKNGRRFTRITLDRALYDELSDTTTLRIKAGRVDRKVEIVRFAKAASVFRKCEDDLLRAWEVDPASIAEGRSASYAGDLTKYFSPDDYPKEAINQGYIGRVTAVLNIDAAGKVTKCRAVVGAGKVLNEATCARASVVTFTPGKDTAGKAAPSVFILSVRWKIG